MPEEKAYTSKIEEEVLKFWEENKIYEKVKERGGDKKFFLMDGPPYASGEIHMGHAWNKVLKDAFLRFYRLNGYDVFDVPGWDTHGTPIEVKVEKEMNLQSKKEIYEKGVERFVKKCEEFAKKYVGKMTEQFKNIGVWMDWDNAYMTLTKEYIESAWWVFKRAWERGLIRKGKYPVHVCPRCETVVSFAEIEYKEVEDPSIYVKFPYEEGNLLIWTTTPWTLPSNVAVMVNPHEKYVLVEVSGEKYTVAERRLEHVAQELGWKGYKIMKRFYGRDLEGVGYTPPFPELPCQKGIKHKIVLSERYVSVEEGTGLVHSAPGHGKEDYEVGVEYNLPVISPVEMNGRFAEDAGKYAGLFVKDADREIINDLERKGLLVKADIIRHKYPICWRCKSRLLFLAVEEWFCEIGKIIERVREEAEKVRWSPEWGKERFMDWINNLKDWPISRQRFWGIPVPIWKCSCGHFEVIGSVDELKSRGANVPEDVHRPWIDMVKYRCPKCGGTMKRIPDVLDVWFDSGVTTVGVFGYPKRKELFEKYWPADLEIEGVDQIRGWWNSQLLTGVMALDRVPYKNVIMHGLILDIHGIKMSKSLGNVINPYDVVDKYSRDVLRTYLLSRPLGKDVNFDWEAVRDCYGFINIYWNIYRLIARFPQKEESRDVEDRWIISRMNSTIKEVRESFENLRPDKAIKAIRSFIVEDLSRKYIKLSRDKIKEGKAQVLRKVFKKAIIVSSPMVPFISEYIYKKLYGEKESVFLEEFPREEMPDKELEEKMDIVFKTSETVLALRNKIGVKRRWPIKEVALSYVDKIKGCEDVLAKFVNAKRVTGDLKEDFVKEETNWGVVGIPKKLSEEEIEEGLARDVLRKIQEKRKEMGLIEKDRIKVHIWGNEKLVGCVKKYEMLIKKKAGITEIKYQKEDKGKKIKINDMELFIKIEVL